MELDASLLPTAIKAYAYHPLPDGYVRFVEVFCGTTNTPLRCRIFMSCLNDALLVPFEALSYVWGKQEPLYDLVCSDVEASVLRIGPNLRDGLLHLRFHLSITTKPRLLWIDRICLNQDDVKERASQILLMRSIYRKCRQALVWLGREDPNTEEAFKCAQHIYENALGRRETLAQFRSPAVSWAKLSDCLRTLIGITYRPWFEGAWTFQEVILPSKVILVCGNSSIPLEYLETCELPAIHRTGAIFAQEAQLIFATRRIEDTFSQDSGRLPPDGLERLLSFRRSAKMSDPRDYFFSLLGLFSPSVSLAITPNFSVSVKDLFTTVAKYVLRESVELRILCSVESPKHLEGESFPSWVPDWRASPESLRNVLHDRNPRSPYQATRTSNFRYNPSPNLDELHLDGIPAGAVEQVGRCNDIHSISNFSLGSRYYHTNQPIAAALRQVQTLEIDVAYERITVGHSQRRSLAAFYDLPMESRVRRKKCDQCHITHLMPMLSMKKARQDPELAHTVRSCSENIASRMFSLLILGISVLAPIVLQWGIRYIFLLVQTFHSFFDRPARNFCW